MGENPQTIEFHINRDDAKHRPDGEKINILLDLGFDSNERMTKVECILNGNGKAGLVSVVDKHTAAITTIWRIVLILLSSVFAAAIAVILTGLRVK